MNNLMKAELFRLRHSGNMMLLIVSVGIIATLMQFVGNEGLDITAETYFLHASIGISMSVICSAGLVTSTFSNQLVNYEIMKGTPPMQMILSKIIISLFLTTATYFLPSMILLMIFDGDNITLPMMLMLYVCLAKIIISAVSICIIFKNAAGIMVFMFGFMFQSMPLVILQNLVGINVVPLTSLLSSTQIMIIGNLSVLDMEELSMPLNTDHFELKILFSFILLIAVMIPIAYKSLKEKWEIKIITQK